MKTTAEILLHNANNINKQFGNVFKIFDLMREQNVLTCPKYVQFPREIVHLSIATSINMSYPQLGADKFKAANIATHLSSLVYAYYNWRIWKKIYSFDDTLTKELIEQADEMNFHDINIPYDILMHLPFDGMFIDAKISETYEGVFVHLDKDSTSEYPVLCFSFIRKLGKDNGLNLYSDVADFDIYLIKDKTIGECMDFTTDKINQEARNNPDLFPSDFSIEEDADRNQKRAINLLLYILAANADVERNKEQAKIYRERKVNQPIKDKFREVDIFDVGIHIGAALRKVKETNNESYIRESNSSSGSSKRPHARRGHWHHYWTGKRSSPDERKLIVKWIPPIVINGYESDKEINDISITPVVE